MKLARLSLCLVLTAAAAGTAGWYLGRRAADTAGSGASAAPSTSRKLLYYQSAMHPWIKSDGPGNCTICGMKLTPVYEGEQGFDAPAGVTTLGSNAIQVIHVQTEPVARRPLVRTLRVAGTVQENETRRRVVSAYVDGRLDQLGINFVGEDVEAGQTLATFYSPMLLAAEREYVAVSQAVAAGDGVPTPDPARLVELAAERLRRLGLEAAQIAALPSKAAADIHSRLLAPVSGTVLERFVFAGQYVKEGDKLFEIADLSTMWFLFDVYERDLAWLQEGQAVTLRTSSQPGRTFGGRVAFIDPNVRELTRAAKVRVELDNPRVGEGGRSRRLLLRQLYAEAEVSVEVPEVVAVPRSAVLAPGAQPVAYVDLGEGAYEMRRLRLGRVGDTWVEVLEGLAPGERVVTTGNFLIDAQAELNRSADPAAAAAPDPVMAAPEAGADRAQVPPLSEAQVQLVQAWAQRLDGLSRALAADDLAAFNAQAPQFHAGTPPLLDGLGAVEPLRPWLARLEGQSHLEAAPDLASARRAFFRLSEAAVELVRRLRGSNPGLQALKLYRCPMVHQALPDLPKVGHWLQTQPPLRNPYFGAEMLECGTEVKL